MRQNRDSTNKVMDLQTIDFKKKKDSSKKVDKALIREREDSSICWRN